MKSIIKSQLLGKKMMYLYFLVLLMSMIIGGFGDNITQMIPPVSLKQYRLYHSNDTDVLYEV